MVAVPRACEMCTSAKPAPAVVFCDADACFLCAKCDEDVHGANRLAQRHVRRPVSTMESQPASEESDLLVPDVADDAISRQVGTSADQGSVESDVAYADFDEFEGVAFAKMPALNASDSDNFLSIVPSGGLKSFDSDELSWDAVVPEFEHVVPDIEAMSIPQAKTLSLALKVEHVPGASLGLKVEHVPAASTPPTPPVSDAHVPAAPVVPVIGSTRPPVKKITKLNPVAVSSPAMSNVTVPSPTVSSSMSKLTSSSQGDASSPSTLKSSTVTVDQPSENPVVPSEEPKTSEQRKQIRLEALARFRAKRANRSFQKKIRYGCRQRLAESRPRVKGRFVRKADMALYRRYGANYADYKDLAETAVESAPATAET